MKCECCNKNKTILSNNLKVCLNCLRDDFKKSLPYIKKTHQKSRTIFNLPNEPPKSPNGISCDLCVNECKLSNGEISYCGLRKNQNGKIIGVNKQKGNVSWYLDNLPTNCVADWVCPAGSNSGYPEYSYTPGPEYGYKNLAVFFQGCSFNCLFCQNWHWRDNLIPNNYKTPNDLANAIDNRTSCICFFGGDPSTQITFAIQASKIALEKYQNRILRICWETNGTMNFKYLKEIAELSLKSGGCIKFDIKSWSKEINIALCGVGNKNTLENFRRLAEYTKIRSNPPFLIASTLLIPGYIDKKEISNIAKFIASLNPEIPYSLLGFYPQFFMHDLPTTSRSHAEECKKVAEDAGLKNINIGNIQLLGNNY